MEKKLFLNLLFCFLIQFSFAATLTSVQSGGWANKNTWDLKESPEPNDEIIIKTGHTVTFNESSYTHYGNITVESGGKLVLKNGNAHSGFTFEDGEFHVFGILEVIRDLEISGTALFWSHEGSIVTISDILSVTDSSQVIVENICLEVEDDLYLIGTEATLCGNGGISIGPDSTINQFITQNGAGNNQICSSTGIFHGEAADCDILITEGSGNNLPIGINDREQTNMNVAKSITVLSLGIADSDPDLDTLKIFSAGNNGFDFATVQGGTVALNDNGSPDNLSDDFIDYTPPPSFVGTDTFYYVITDQQGGYSQAMVLMDVLNPLPVELVSFDVYQSGCAIVVQWTTAEEENNDYFEVEKSTNGYHFTTVQKIAGKGTSRNTNVYQITDEHPGKINYYRLKQVDYDGTATTSSLVVINNRCANEIDEPELFSVYPNPLMGDRVNIRIQMVEATTQKIILSDWTGQILQAVTLDLEKGRNFIKFDIDDLPAGTYMIMADNQSRRFVKLRD